jgi:hypothetical protein
MSLTLIMFGILCLLVAAASAKEGREGNRQ